MNCDCDFSGVRTSGSAHALSRIVRQFVSDIPLDLIATPIRGAIIYFLIWGPSKHLYLFYNEIFQLLYWRVVFSFKGTPNNHLNATKLQ